MSIESELEAIQTSAAIFPLTDRAFLRITGSDATRWLNGMVTNNIKDLAPGEGNYNFLLNSQGRILGDCTIYREPGDGDPTYLLETDAAQIEAIQQHLDKFIIMDDVELTSGLSLIGHPVTGMAVVGAKAPNLIHRLLSEINDEGVPQPLPIPVPGTMTYAVIPPKHKPGFWSLPQQHLLFILTPPTASVPRFSLWFEGDKDLQDERRLMEAHGAIDLSNQTQEAHRILSARPKYGQDIRNTDTAKDLPQETAQTHALHFSKGCYLGQEIVERIHSRGQVHRTFTQFHLTGDMPQLPAALHSNGKSVGELTSAVQIGDKIIALGYLRREFQHQPLTYPGGTATPTTASKHSETNKLVARS